MKVMDVSTEEKDTSIQIVTPPKKKMKQARLPFQMLSPIEPTNTVSNKKRKLDSPSPNDCKGSRVGKVTTKENAIKKAKGSEPEIVELSDEETEKMLERDIDTNQEGSDKTESKDLKNHETGSKKQINFGTLAAFLKKARSKEESNDVGLVAMSDYESGNSKDSDFSLKSKTDDDRTKDDSKKDFKRQNDGSTTESIADEIYDTKSDENNVETSADKSTVEERKKSEDNESRERKKSSITSDDNDQKNIDSDSDHVALSSDEDPDEEPDKSSNETDGNDKTTEEIKADGTPKASKSSDSAMKNRKLTPKQVERRLESAKKREERKQLKLEKEKKREEERESRRKEKEGRRKEREEKEKAEKEQKRKEKELKQKEKEAKEEDRRKREEAKEEEKKKKEEEKLEAERKKQKAATNFVSFFVAKKLESRPMEEEKEVEVYKNFMPFEVKVDMRVAPVTRRTLDEDNKSRLDQLFNKGLNKNQLYLGDLKTKRRRVGKSGKTWPFEAKDDVVIIDEEDEDGTVSLVEQGSISAAKQRAKLLMFAENRRPPYWGTWRKKSDHINPRRPFFRDAELFDYEVDSDDEWEEEEPGESLRGSDDERDEEGPEENEYDVDNEFMVPHGYLSDEEAKADEEDCEDASPETQKAKLKLLGEQFEAERNTKTSKIKPKVVGCIWQGPLNAFAENTAPHIIQFLMARQAWVREIPVALCPIISANSPSARDCGSPTQTSNKQTPGAKKKRVPTEAYPDLIRLVHGNTHSRIFLVKEFMAFWEKNPTVDKQISKLSVSQKIKEIAKYMPCPEEGPMRSKSCWYVREEVRKEHNCSDLTLPNRWSYTLPPKRRSEVVDSDKPEKEEREKKTVPLITQFTKKFTQDEMHKQLTAKSLVHTKPTPPKEKPPKRAALISVARGEQFPKTSRNNLLTKFISCGNSKSVESGEERKEAEGDGDETTETKDRKDETKTGSPETGKSRNASKIKVTSDKKTDDERTKNDGAKVKVVNEKAGIAPKRTETLKKIETDATTGGKRADFNPEPMDTDEDCIILD